MKTTKKSLSCQLESDSYYWKQNKKNSSIQYAFFHEDDEPCNTFLIMFDSCEAESCVIYSMLDEDDPSLQKSKNEINSFIYEVTDISLNDQEKKYQWQINRRLDMVITDKMRDIVNKEFMIRNIKKNNVDK